MKRFFFLTLFGLLCGNAVAADFSPPWDQFWKDCHDLNLPIFRKNLETFKELIRSGDSWETLVVQEKLEIDSLVAGTCKAWAASPNGDSILQEFTVKFGKIASTAISLQGEARNTLLPAIQRWWKVESAELKRHGFRLENFPCGQGLAKIQNHVQIHVTTLEKKLTEVREKCPKAADEIVRKTQLKLQEETKAARNAPLTGPKGKSKPGISDITGTENFTPSLDSEGDGRKVK